MGSVTRRPAADVEEVMGELARQDRIRITTPIPRPPRAPGRFFIVRRPPLPSPPQINPVVPDVQESARWVQAAAISARARENVEEIIRPLLEEAASAAPRGESPPSRDDDVYDLAKWNRRYSRWT